MSLEPGTDTAGGCEGRGGETVRQMQVQTGRFGVDAGSVPGAGGNGNGEPSGIDLIRRVVNHERSERALRRLAAIYGELSYDELRRRGVIADEEAMLRAEYYTLGDGWLDVAGICAASNGEAMAMVEELGLSVRGRDDYLDSLPDHFGVEVVDDGGTDFEIGGDSSPVDLHADMMCHPDASDAISNSNAEDEDNLREVGLLHHVYELDDLGIDAEGADDEDDDSDNDDPNLEDELELWAGTDGDDSDDIANLFEQRVERVLAQGNRRYSK